MKKPTVSVLAALAGAAVGTITAKTKSSKKIAEMADVHEKVHELYMAFDQWLQIRQQGKTLVEVFERYDYKRIAVYGMRELGKRLCDELKDSDVVVSYAIDKNADFIEADIDVVTPDAELAPVDVIVVTAITFFDEIEKELLEKVECPIISLKDIFDEILDER